MRSTWAGFIGLFALLFLVAGGGILALGQRQADHRAVTSLLAELAVAVRSHGTDADRAARTASIRSIDAGWTAVGEGVAEAKTAWGTGEAAETLASGSDPFADTVWKPYNTAQLDLAQLSVVSAADLRAASDEATREHGTTKAAVALAMVFVLIVGVVGSRTMSRAVIRPLISLRSAVARLQDGDLATDIDLPRSTGGEIVELADAIGSMASALGASQAHLRDQAQTDGLTGLVNRRAFNEVLETACSQGCDARTSVLLIDIDDFKDVNDSFGHAAGDELLVHVATRLRAQARPSDTVARIGGDEFAMVIQGDDSLGAALAVAERLMAAFDDELAVDGTRVQISCSVGIADGHGAVTADDIVRHADAAMYVAKGRGKNCFEPFDPMLHATMLSRSALKDELHDAADNDQLELHYQPVIDLDSSSGSRPSCGGAIPSEGCSCRHRSSTRPRRAAPSSASVTG